VPEPRWTRSRHNGFRHPDDRGTVERSREWAGQGDGQQGHKKVTIGLDGGFESL